MIEAVKSPIRSYRDLEVWQLAVELFVLVTRLVRSLPTADRFVFETQMRRAARSVSANISEGHQRRDLGDYLRHLSFSRGSVAEVETDLTLIEQTTAASKELIAECFELAGRVGQKVTALSASLRRKRQ
jgi:four helix bundle protein